MKLIVGITEARGVTYGVKLLAYLSKYQEIETRLIMDDAARQRILSEMRWTPEMLAGVTGDAWDRSNGSAAHGTVQSDAVIVAPCSPETLATLSAAPGGSMLAEAAESCLAGGGRVVLLVTETPLGSEDLQLMLAASRKGAVILPCPALHPEPASVEDIANDAVAAALGLVGLDRPDFRLAAV